jgi:sporulation protein YlmC with PRC-barrel domain
MGALKEASQLMGSRVNNSSGKILGHIHELAINLPQGEITTVIVATGGILGVGERLVALPPQTLSLGVENEVNADVDIERWSNAPDFDPEEWNLSTHPDRVAANARYFNVQPRTPYRAPTTHPSHETSLNPPQQTPSVPAADAVRASELIGTTVLGETGETIGDVEDLIVDLSWGRVAQVIVSSGGFLGIGEELSAIPPVLFVRNPGVDHLELKANKALLTSAPRFKIGQWKDHSSPKAVHQVYSAYRLQPYFDPTLDADPARFEVRDRVDPSQPGTIQGASDAQARLTENIQ